MADYGVQSQVLRDSGADVARCVSDLQDLTQRIDRVVQVGCEAWDGTAMQAYAGQWQTQKGVMDGELVEMLTTIGQNLVAVAESYESLDREIASKLNG